MAEKRSVPIPVTGCDHIAMAVPDLDAAIDLLSSQFAISIGQPKVVSDQGIRMAYADLGNVTLELMEPLNSTSPVNGFLEKRPLGGLHHICLATPDARKAHQDATSAGLTIIGPLRPGHHGRDLFFLSPAENCGTLIEIENEDTDP